MKLKVKDTFFIIDDSLDLPFDLITFKLDKDGYVHYRFKKDSTRKSYRLHRIILNITDPKIQIDHINGDKLDNRKENLRLTNSFGNQQNRRKINKKTYSKYKGVTWHKYKKIWKAKITAFNIVYNLGGFIKEEAAAIAYNIAAIKYHGEYANLNDVDMTIDHEKFRGIFNKNKTNTQRKIINIKDNKIFKSIKDAALEYGLSYSSLRHDLCSHKFNMGFKYV